MPKVSFDIFSTLTASLLFALIFLVLYAIEKKKYLLFWSLSWWCFTTTLLFRFIHTLSDLDIHLPFFQLSMHYLSGYFLLIGAIDFLSRKTVILASKIIGSLYILIFLFYLISDKQSLIQYSVFLTTASIFCYTGYTIYTHTKKFSIGGRIAGISLMLWGIHKADYPFAKNIEILHSAGYHIAIILTLTIASGIILLHFEKVKCELKEREKNFRSLADISKDIVFTVMFKPELELVYISPSVEKITGYSFEDISKNKQLQDRYFLDFFVKIQGVGNSFLKDKMKSNVHKTYSKGGQELVLEYKYTNYYDINGSLEKAIGYAQDITNNLLAFDTLIDRQDWYEAIFQKSNNMQMLIDAESRFIVDANKPLTTFYKYDIDDLREMSIEKLFISKTEADQFWSTSLKGNDSGRYTTINKFGNLKTVMMSASKLEFGETKYLYVTITDVTSEIFFQTQLKNITKLHSAILESLNEGVMGIDEFGNIFFLNRFGQDLLGYRDIDLVGKNPHDTIHYDSADGHIGIDDCPMMRFIKSEESSTTYRDYLKKKNGVVFPVQVSMSFLRYYDNEKKCIVIFKDITNEMANEKKMLQQLDDNTVLLQEVHHRVKNNLQIICSLLSLQIESLNDEQQTIFLNDSISRIKSMSLIHELLYKTKGLNALSIKTYLEKLTFDLKCILVLRDDIVLKHNLDDENISLEKAVPSGLIMTELFTNAVKHAFSDDDNNKVIEVGFHTDDKNHVMWIHDNGSALTNISNIENSKSLGYTVIRSLTKQLDGELEFIISDGLLAKVTFPK